MESDPPVKEEESKGRLMEALPDSRLLDSFSTTLSNCLFEETEPDSCLVESLPDSLLLHIFNHLVARDVLSCTQVCARWRAVAYDESLWKSLVYRHWNIGGSISPGHCSWRSEYKRLYYHAPLIWSETLTEHTDEVFHVTFSHNGSLFATTSKDATVKVWQVGYPTKIVHYCDFKDLYNWDITQFSSFSEDDTMLMVNGVKFRPFGRTGHIAIFSVQQDFSLVRLLSMNPNALFGTWLKERTLLSSSLERTYMDMFPNTVQIQATTVSPADQSPPRVLVESDADVTVYSFTREAAHRLKFLNAAKITQKDISPEHGTVKTDKADDVKNHSWVFMTDDFHIKFHDLSYVESSSNTVSELDVERTEEVIVDGNVNGLHVSRDQRYLFANCQPWVGDFDRDDPWVMPKLSTETEIRVIDLQELRDTGVRYTGHKGYVTGCYIFLDSSHNYIGSGSENSRAYLWDRHYKCCLGTFDHGPGVVNAVAFNSHDEECFVTVSDDHTIKIWRSRNRQSSFNTDT